MTTTHGLDGSVMDSAVLSKAGASGAALGAGVVLLAWSFAGVLLAKASTSQTMTPRAMSARTSQDFLVLGIRGIVTNSPRTEIRIFNVGDLVG